MTYHVGTSVATTAGGDPQIPYPTTTAGGCLVAFGVSSIAFEFASDAMADDGFTLHSVLDSATLTPTIGVFTKPATGSEAGTANLVSTGGGGGGAFWGAMICVDGIDTFDPFGGVADAIFQSGTATGAYTLPAQTTLAANSVLITFAACNTTAGTWTPPAGYTELFDEANTVDRMQVCILDNQAAIGTTGTRAVVKAGTTSRGCALGLALQPQSSNSPEFLFRAAGAGAYSRSTKLRAWNGSAYVDL